MNNWKQEYLWFLNNIIKDICNIVYNECYYYFIGIIILEGEKNRKGTSKLFEFIRWCILSYVSYSWLEHNMKIG